MRPLGNDPIRHAMHLTIQFEIVQKFLKKNKLLIQLNTRFPQQKKYPFFIYIFTNQS